MSRLFYGRLKGDSGSFKWASGVFKDKFNGYNRKFSKVCHAYFFKGFSTMFQGSFKGGSRKFQGGFQGRLKGVQCSMEF